MKKLLSLILLLAICGVGSAKTYRVLLIGDSTTVGSIPALCHPERPHLSKVLETIFNGKSAEAKIEVLYSAKGGESAATVVATGRYDEEIRPLKDQGIDIIIVRYGINDWYKCKDKDMEFPRDLNLLWAKIEQDFPGAQLIAQTITPFLPEGEDVRMNNHIKAVAAKRKIVVNDIYTPFVEAQRRDGVNSYWVRQRSLKDIDECYHEMLKPYTYKRAKNQIMVLADDNSLDALLYVEGKSGWVNHHPNTAGYMLVARESAGFLLGLLSE
ncbi:MAG: SGNH/GDSL hydrolase family protein [Rikenellaceae bacterium]